MLNVEPKLRPSCAQLLEMPQVRKRIMKLFPDEDFGDSSLYTYDEDTHESTFHNELLNTIKVPHNLAQLTKRLPKSNYSK